MQAKGNAPPVGAIFDTALSSSQHVLAMAALYQMQAARETRVASLSVSLPDLRAVAFCEALARYLSGSPSRNTAPIGMPIPQMQALAQNRMAEAVLGERTPAGEPRYPHGIMKLNDTADVAATIRNGISAQQPGNATVIVAGPLSNVAAAMALPDMAELAPKRVRALVLSASAEELRSDLPAARKILADWPTPLVLVDAPGVVFPGGELESRFAWAMNSPVREAYRAYQPMPYDAPLQSALAVLHAVRPASEFFHLSGAGTIEVAENGSTRFQPGSGTRKLLRLAENQQEAAVQALVELVTAQPPQPQTGRGRGGPQK